MMRARGYTILEILLCVAILSMIMAGIAAALGGMQRALYVTAQRETLASVWTNFSTFLCDDLRRGTQATWQPPAPKGPAQTLIAVDQPGGVQVVYAYVPGTVERQVFRGGKKAEHRPFALNLVGVEAKVAPAGSGSPDDFWPGASAEAGRVLRVENGRVPFVQIVARVDALDGTSRTMVTGAALRRETQP